MSANIPQNWNVYKTFYCPIYPTSVFSLNNDSAQKEEAFIMMSTCFKTKDNTVYVNILTYVVERHFFYYCYMVF